jgi:hypothetical protein
VGAEPERSTSLMEGERMAHTRAADDFQAIRARMEELRRERDGVEKRETRCDRCRYRFVAPMAIR